MSGYPAGPFTRQYTVGGTNGNWFQACKWVTNSSALVVQRLDVWWNSGTLKGIQVTYADGSRSQVFGSPNDSTASISFAPGELVTSLSLWGNGIGTRCGRIRLTTNLGQTFDHGKNTSGQTQYDGPVGSGVLVGLVGRSGHDVDQLGAVFLRSAVKSIKIGNVKYTPSLHQTSDGISEVILGQTYYSNPPDSPKDFDWDFINTVTRTKSTSFSQTSSNMYGANASVTVSAELFGIGTEATAGFEWQATKTQETTTETEESVELTWSLSGQLAPGTGLTAISTCQQGIGDATYTSTVTLLLADGTVSKYPENGVFTNVVYTKATATAIKDVNRKPSVPIEGPYDN